MKAELFEDEEEESGDDGDLEAINYSRNTSVFSAGLWHSGHSVSGHKGEFMKKANEESKKKLAFDGDTGSDFYKSNMGVPKSTNSSASVFSIDNILSSKPKFVTASGAYSSNFVPFSEDRNASFSTSIATSMAASPFQFRHHPTAVNLNQLASVAAVASFSPSGRDFLSTFHTCIYQYRVHPPNQLQ